MHAWRSASAFDGSRFLDGGATVLVDGGRIIGVEPAAYDVPADCPLELFDGTLMPGLLDAHSHLVADGSPGSLERVEAQSDGQVDAEIARSLAVQAAHGVTTVRDLGDRDYRTLAFREDAAGRPRVLAAGPPITMPGGHCHFLGCVATTPEELRAAVRDHHERGVDVVKVMASGGFLTAGTDMFGAQFEAEVLRSVVEEAHDLGLAVLAHAHSTRGIEAALAAGVDGIEHFTGISEDGHDLSDDLLDRVAAAGVLVDPTSPMDPRLMAQLPPPPPQVRETMERLGLDMPTFLAARIANLGRMREHGVRVVPGVDSGAMPLKPHGSQWIALTDLVDGGWPVDEALRAGTSQAAEACGIGDETGSLRAGRAADLLVLEGDVRTDPAALGRPLAVAVRGVAVRG